MSAPSACKPVLFITLFTLTLLRHFGARRLRRGSKERDALGFPAKYWASVALLLGACGAFSPQGSQFQDDELKKDTTSCDDGMPIEPVYCDASVESRNYYLGVEDGPTEGQGEMAVYDKSSSSAEPLFVEPVVREIQAGKIYYRGNGIGMVIYQVGTYYLADVDMEVGGVSIHEKALLAHLNSGLRRLLLESLGIDLNPILDPCNPATYNPLLCGALGGLL